MGERRFNLKECTHFNVNIDENNMQNPTNMKQQRNPPHYTECGKPVGNTNVEFIELGVLWDLSYPCLLNVFMPASRCSAEHFSGM